MKVEANRLDATVNYEKANYNKKVETNRNTVEKVEKEVVIEEKRDIKDIENSVQKINKHLEASNTKLKFKIHESPNSMNNKVSIKVVDEESDKVIAEIPSEEAIELSERMEQIIGFLFDECK